jgi:hypothetical protein
MSLGANQMGLLQALPGRRQEKMMKRFLLPRSPILKSKPQMTHSAHWRLPVKEGGWEVE